MKGLSDCRTVSPNYINTPKQCRVHYIDLTMGILEMKKLLDLVAPAASRQINGTEFADTFGGKRIAFDAYFYVFNAYKGGSLTPRAIALSMDRLLSRYAKVGASGYFVLDGFNVLPLKAEIAHVKRRAATDADRDQLETTEERMKDIWKRAHERRVKLDWDEIPGVTDQVLPAPTGPFRATAASLGLATRDSAIEALKAEADEAHVDYVKYKTRSTRPGTAHYLAAARVAKKHGFKPVRAYDEGERLCSYMAKTGQVDFCATDDWDALPFGSPQVLRWPGSPRPMVVTLATILERVSYETFVDMCILMGSDYSKRVYLFGPGKIFKKFVPEDGPTPSTLKIENLASVILSGKSKKPKILPDYETARTYFFHQFDDACNQPTCTDPIAGLERILKSASGSSLDGKEQQAQEHPSAAGDVFAKPPAPVPEVSGAGTGAAPDPGTATTADPETGVAPDPETGVTADAPETGEHTHSAFHVYLVETHGENPSMSLDTDEELEKFLETKGESAFRSCLPAHLVLKPLGDPDVTRWFYDEFDRIVGLA